jgi:hypothetical protein
MANPSPEAISAIRAEVSDWTSDDASIAASLDAPTIANPAPRPTVPVALTVSGVLGALSAESKAKLHTVAFVPAIRDAINAQDRAACGLWAQILMDGGVITPAEGQALMGLLSATQPDPSWPAEISWAESTLGRLVDPEDVAAARPQGA